MVEVVFEGIARRSDMVPNKCSFANQTRAPRPIELIKSIRYRSFAIRFIIAKRKVCNRTKKQDKIDAGNLNLDLLYICVFRFSGITSG